MTRRYTHRGHTIFEDAGKYSVQPGISRTKFSSLERAKKAIDRYLGPSFNTRGKKRAVLLKYKDTRAKR